MIITQAVVQDIPAVPAQSIFELKSQKDVKQSGRKRLPYEVSLL